MKNQSEILKLYQSAINDLDDYFEYRYLMGSLGTNREFVIGVLDNLTKNIKELNENDNSTAEEILEAREQETVHEILKRFGVGVYKNNKINTEKK